MFFNVRSIAIVLAWVVWLSGAGFSWADMNKSCDEIRTVKVSPEEFMGDKSLTKQMSDLIAQGLKMAVQQVTDTRIRGETSETIRNDDGNYKHSDSQRFRGTVTSHKILKRELEKLGNKETLRITLQVNVCVRPADQVWYARIENIKSEKRGHLEWMQSRLKSPTDRIQLVRSGEQGAKDAAYRIQGLVFSENVAVRRFTNRNEIRAYQSCVRNQRSQARSQSRMLQSFGLGKLGGIVQGLGADSNSCGNQPQFFSGKRLEADAIFEIKICDTHLGDCQSARQPYQSMILIKTAQKTGLQNRKFYRRTNRSRGLLETEQKAEQEVEVAIRKFYYEGFGFVGAIALQNLQKALGMLDK